MILTRTGLHIIISINCNLILKLRSCGSQNLPKVDLLSVELRGFGDENVHWNYAEVTACEMAEMVSMAAVYFIH